ncbi:MAG: DinB family protein [Deltaproteobacteria bacterium]
MIATISSTTIARPNADEHSAYYARYIERVPDGDIVSMLRDQIGNTAALLRSLPSDRAEFAYAPGKWTVKQVVGHMTDVERVMSYRALRFSRNDSTELPGFDENDWVANSNFAARTLADLVDEYQAVRAATIHFAKHLDADASMRRGTANGQGVSVRALLYIIAGHELHHVALVRERYL